MPCSPLNANRQIYLYKHIEGEQNSTSLDVSETERLNRTLIEISQSWCTPTLTSLLLPNYLDFPSPIHFPSKSSSNPFCSRISIQIQSFLLLLSLEAFQTVQITILIKQIQSKNKKFKNIQQKGFAGRHRPNY